MGGRGSLSTIVAGVLVLMALIIGILIGATALSMMTTLGSVTANHVREVGVESAMYSGLVTQGNELISTRGPITIIGAVTPRGFTWINKTTQYYVANTTEPELLLTNVGPVLLDPVEMNINNAPGQDLAEQAATYLYHWVTLGVNGINFPAGGLVHAYVGAIIRLGGNYYLLSMGWGGFPATTNTKQVIPIGAIGVPFLIGPLNNTNSVILGDYGYGHAGCAYVYPLNCPPTPPGGSNLYFRGPIPIVTLNQGNIAITIPQGTQFTNLGPHPDYPTEAVVYLLTQDAQFYEYLVVFNISGTVIYCPNIWTCDTTNVSGKIIYYPYKPQSNYQIVPISVESNGTLAKPVTINLPQPPTNNYYVILVIWANNSEFPAWFAWHIANNTVNWPRWLSSQTTNIIEPQQYNNPSINT